MQKTRPTKSVFFRRFRFLELWKEVSKRLYFSSFATVQHLFNALVEKWQLRDATEESLILRTYDKEFDEFLDIEEDFSLVSLENMGKYELIHRVTEYGKMKNADPKNNNVLFESKNEPRLNEEFVQNVQNLDLPTTDLTNIIKNLQENAIVSQNFKNQ